MKYFSFKNYTEMKKIVLILMVILCVAVSCQDAVTITKELKQSSVTLNDNNLSTGKTAELLLVMDKNWPEEVQDTIYSLLQKPQVGLPQEESLFSIYHINNDLFKGDFTRRANIVYIDVNASYTEAECKTEKNPWSKPQIYAHICAPTKEAAITCLAANRDQILDAMFDNDIAKLQMVQAKTPNVELQDYIQKKFGILMTVPQEYEIGREGDDFLWLLYRTKKNDRFIMIYTSPNKKLTREAMIIKRNYITSKYIEGETKDIHPKITEYANYPLHQPLKIWSKEGAELRGLWETTNDYMGGPFYQFSFININGECVTIDGSVYAPEEKKRVYMRQVEAIVKSVK